MMQRPAKGESGPDRPSRIWATFASMEDHDSLCVFHPDNSEPRQLSIQDMLYCCTYCGPNPVT